jgi:hypothetical protein
MAGSAQIERLPSHSAISNRSMRLARSFVRLTAHWS